MLSLGQHAAVDRDDLIGKVPCLDHPYHSLVDFVRATNDAQWYSLNACQRGLLRAGGGLTLKWSNACTSEAVKP